MINIATIENETVTNTYIYNDMDEANEFKERGAFTSADEIAELPEGFGIGDFYKNGEWSKQPIEPEAEHTQPNLIQMVESISNSIEAQGVFTLLNLGIDVPVEGVAKASNLMAQNAELASPPDDEAWRTKTYYSDNTIVVYGGKRYICAVSHISQDNWTPADVPSLWVEIKEEFAEWKQPSGSHDAYRIGDKVLFGGKKYECIIDFNTYSPGVYPAGWKEIV